MKFAIDVRCLSGSPNLNGISQYTKHLLTHLFLSKEHSFFLFPGFSRPKNHNIYEYFLNFPENVRWKWSPVPIRIVEKLWKTGWPPLELITGKMDVLFEPNFFAPPIRNAKIVTTVHDLSFVWHPEWFPGNEAARRTKMLIENLSRADALIAVSRFTADEIGNFWPQAQDKVHVICEAPGPEFQPPTAEKIRAVIKSRLNLNDHFILYLGALELRKNLTSLVRGYLRLRKGGGTKSKLVLAGLKGHGYEEVIKVAYEGIRHGWIQFAGYVNQDEVSALYGAADLFCYLSHYEGFGLPPLEALACGTPVLASRIPVLMETLGPHALYVDPLNIPEISDGIAQCEKKPVSSIEERIAWASRFTWQKASEKTLDLFERIHENRHCCLSCPVSIWRSVPLRQSLDKLFG